MVEVTLKPSPQPLIGYLAASSVANDLRARGFKGFYGSLYMSDCHKMIVHRLVWCYHREGRTTLSGGGYIEALTPTPLPQGEGL